MHIILHDAYVSHSASLAHDIWKTEKPYQDREALTTKLAIPQSLVDQAEAQMKALEQDPNMQMHEAEMLKAQPHMWTMIELGKMAQLTL